MKSRPCKIISPSAVRKSEAPKVQFPWGAMRNQRWSDCGHSRWLPRVKTFHHGEHHPIDITLTGEWIGNQTMLQNFPRQIIKCWAQFQACHLVFHVLSCLLVSVNTYVCGFTRIFKYMCGGQRLMLDAFQLFFLKICSSTGFLNSPIS